MYVSRRVEGGAHGAARYDYCSATRPQVMDSNEGLNLELEAETLQEEFRVPSTVSFAHHISSAQYENASNSNGEDSLDVSVRVVQVGSQRAVLQVEDLHTSQQVLVHSWNAQRSSK